MQEHNHATLAKAIKELPAYAPPVSVWDRIEPELDLQEGIQNLPEHSPPAMVWEAIATELETQDTVSKVKQLNPRRAYWAAAASVAVLLVAALYLWPNFQKGENIVYESTVVEGTFVFQANWDEDDQMLHLAVEQYRNDPLAQQNEDYDQYLKEWEELNAAKAEIKTMMERYGKDSRLVRQLGSIERERTEVVKEMVVQI